LWRAAGSTFVSSTTIPPPDWEHILRRMKVFSIEEANALLPKVRTILLKLRAAHTGVASMREGSKEASLGAERGGGGMLGGARYVSMVEQLAHGSRELESLGVQIKDYERGLIDFPTMRGDRVVLLCWQLGEGDEVTWWHDIDAGFAGRQRL
jgi:hypothetical protein